MSNQMSNALNLPGTLNLPDKIGSQMTATMTGPVTLTLQPKERARFNLRIDPKDLAKASRAFGLEIGANIHSFAEKGSRSALCLGPDEWLLWADEEEKADILKAFADLYGDSPHSLTDISDRQVSINIEGEQAAELLSIGCPRDLSQIKVGTGMRTLFDTAEVVLLRRGETAFTLEVWRSFLPHVRGLLYVGNQELAIGL
ncbi:MAG: sarcosine oxidase [Cohaesibacter sp.]|nr:sarcosine oxidase [Cohaesibacter sp.]